MFTIQINKQEFFDDQRQEFFTIGPWILNFEHSLISISKWEAFYKKPFFLKKEHTEEEILFYIKCMLLENEYKEDVCSFLSKDYINQICEYIKDTQSGTTFGAEDKGLSKETVSSELVYYWMVALEIPFTCETWNFNRLMTLIRICNIKNAPAKKRSKKDILNSHNSLNEARKKKLGTTG